MRHEIHTEALLGMTTEALLRMTTEALLRNEPQSETTTSRSNAPN